MYYNLSMNKKVVYIFIILIVAVLVLGGFFYFQNWRHDKQEKIKLGLAENRFPYREYTQEELNKMYPQIKNADVLTRITPEETYAKFREALRTNDLNMAIEQLSKESEKYEENKNTLTQAHKNSKFLTAIKEYPEEIRKSYMYEAIAQYEYDILKDGKTFVNSITFIKDSNGDWKLDSL